MKWSYELETMIYKTLYVMYEKKEQTRIRNDLLFKTNSFLYIVVTIIYGIIFLKGKC